MKKKYLTVLGVRVDQINMEQTLEKIIGWIENNQSKKTVFTTNVEFIMAAQKDKEFYAILNNSDLSIPDSSRFGWVKTMLEEKNKFKKIFDWFSFPLAHFPGQKDFPIVTGVDLMEKLCQVCAEKGYKIGLLGGQFGVANSAAECLKKRYPELKISYSGDGGRVNESGDMLDKKIISSIPKTDILFVAFGQVKQEKWIDKNKDKVDANVFIGVGGAFDYLSKKVPRAPKAIRYFGLEWLFRLVVEPWRIKRFRPLLEFVFHFLP